MNPLFKELDEKLRECMLILNKIPEQEQDLADEELARAISQWFRKKRT